MEKELLKPDHGILLWECFDARWPDPWGAITWYIDLGVAPRNGTDRLAPGLADRTGLREDQAVAHIHDLWDRRYARESGWPQVTDGDRVEAALARLRAQGFVTAIGWRCCELCGGSSRRSLPGPWPRPSADIHVSGLLDAADGVIDLDHGLAGGPLLEDAPADLAVTEAVERAMRREGLAAYWPGGPYAIRIEGVDWQHRLPRTHLEVAT